jgi:hypothetical protein
MTVDTNPLLGEVLSYMKLLAEFRRFAPESR